MGQFLHSIRRLRAIFRIRRSGLTNHNNWPSEGSKNVVLSVKCAPASPWRPCLPRIRADENHWTRRPQAQPQLGGRRFGSDCSIFAASVGWPTATLCKLRRSVSEQLRPRSEMLRFAVVQKGTDWNVLRDGQPIAHGL